MPDLTKIATCCYCGTRAVLRLNGKNRHELSCASCGAALHTMKPIKTQAAQPGPRQSRPHYDPQASQRRGYHAQRPKKYSKSRKRRSWGYVISEIWDEIEDIFD